jgi:hypothetical protein
MTTKTLESLMEKYEINTTSTVIPKNKKYSKKQDIKQFVSKFKTQFDMKDDAIDLRTMADNYDNGIIPLEDIHQAIITVLGPNYKPEAFDYDPSEGVQITTGIGTARNPKFAYIDWSQAYLWPIFQRDVAPNHTSKIYSDFDPTCVIVPCAIKFTIKGKIYYCIWDGHHTIQVCRLKGYNKFPVWFIDTDIIENDVIAKAGFDPVSERIEYGCWLAGHNMIRINSKNKRKLSPYDEFMIKLETRDAVAIAMHNILVKNNCTPKRHATMAGAFTQIKSGLECYELSDTYGNSGQFWDRALNFHRRVWPKAPLELEVFRPLCILYHRASTQGLALDADFDNELETLLVNTYGDPTTVQETIKESYWDAYYNNKGTGRPAEHDKTRVVDGLINLYNQKVNRATLPPADYVWKV